MNRCTEDLALMRLARKKYLRSMIQPNPELDDFDLILLRMDRELVNVTKVARKICLPESFVVHMLNKISAKLEYKELTC